MVCFWGVLRGLSASVCFAVVVVVDICCIDQSSQMKIVLVCASGCSLSYHYAECEAVLQTVLEIQSQNIGDLEVFDEDFWLLHFARHLNVENTRDSGCQSFGVL